MAHIVNGIVVTAAHQRWLSCRGQLQSLLEDRIKHDPMPVIRFAPHAEVARELFLNVIRPGLIRLNGARVEKSSTAVQAGDIVTLPRGHDVLAVRVQALAARRGPFAEARTLYSIVESGLLDPAAPAS